MTLTVTTGAGAKAVILPDCSGSAPGSSSSRDFGGGSRWELPAAAMIASSTQTQTGKTGDAVVVVVVLYCSSLLLCCFDVVLWRRQRPVHKRIVHG